MLGGEGFDFQLLGLVVAGAGVVFDFGQVGGEEDFGSLLEAAGVGMDIIHISETTVL